VTCIQAGTVRVRATLLSGLGSTTQIFELGKPITTEAEKITLVEVDPVPESGKEPKTAEYLFYFEINKR
jgi:hypothetical protein